jgi:chromate reductase
MEKRIGQPVRFFIVIRFPVEHNQKTIVDLFLLLFLAFMITVIAGTNRPNSRARRLAEFYGLLLTEQGADFQILDLIELPADFTTTALYQNTGNHNHFNQLVAMAESANKLVFIVPEYNCSFPGVLKAFIDGLPYPGGIRGKKAALVGLSSGSQGGQLPLN